MNSTQKKNKPSQRRGMTLSMPDDLDLAVRVRAANRGMTISEYFRSLIRADLQGQ